MSPLRNINIRDYGAVGDGSTDDTAAFQEALAKAQECRGTVVVPAGEYLCSGLRIPPHVGLQGGPTWSFREHGGSIIKLADENAKCLIDMTGAIGATLNGLCLEGGHIGTDIHGVLIEKEDYGSEEDTPCIERCRISHFSGDGIRFTRIWCFRIRNSMISHNKGNGIRVQGWDGFILDNWLSGNGRAGYGAYEENASMTITANRIEWNHWGGIVIHGGNQYNLTGNYIDRSGGPGISLLPRGKKPCEGITATGNVIYRSGAPQWHEFTEHESAQVCLMSVKGLAFTGNTMTAGRDDGGQGEWSPDLGIVYGFLGNAVIKDNVLHQGAMRELIHDIGGNGANVIVKDNVGGIKRPEN